VAGALNVARSCAFVPVRGGSKGIVGKNLLPIGGRALVDWVIDAARGAASIDEVVVSTDDDAIAAHVTRLFSDVRIVRRSPATAVDTASTESAMLEFLDHHLEADPIVLLQATSPLTSPADIDTAVGLLGEGFDSVVSVVRQRRFRWATALSGSGDPDAATGPNAAGPLEASPIGFDPARRPRRQDHQGFLVENGAVYATTRSALRSSGCRVSGRITLLEMPEDTYVELDDPLDVVLVDALVRHRQRPAGPPASIAERARRVKLVISDVDGCLTDNGMYYAADGDELKRFNARDDKGFELLRRTGVRTLLLTTARSPVLARRAQTLQVDDLIEGSIDKLADADRVRTRLALSWDEVAFLGGDVHDLSLLKRVGLSACPLDAAAAVAAAAVWRCPRPGGHGAFRDLADLITAAQS
jgi:YrbI family 3-deoxy-D-manno-octulosonate 8-phosphate phosphatase